MKLSADFKSLCGAVASLGLSFMPSPAICAEGPGKPLALRCEYRANPLGLDEASPRLSWQVDDPRRGAVQSAYQILVADAPKSLDDGSGNVWDSGKVDSDESIHVAYGGPALESGKRYWWKVRTWDAFGQPSPYSDAAWWEMGLLDPDKWSARWITVAAAPDNGVADQPKPRRSVCVRDEFTLKHKPVRARAYASGLGSYQMWINGRRVSLDVLTPDWTYYPKRIQYQTYDVTELLREGRNAVGAVLGNAWWSSGLGWDRRVSYAWGNLRFLLQLNVEYPNGTAESFVTDNTWKAHESPVVRDSIYDGESYDARLEMPGWDRPGFDDRDWTSVQVASDEPLERLVAQQCETIRITEEKSPIALTSPQRGVYVFDFGQNLAGWVRLKVWGPRGTKITLRFGEILRRSGFVSSDNYRSAKSTDEYILKGNGEEVWEPRFTYHGFRYVEVSGWPGEPGREALTACVVHSAVAFAGDFSCSNELLNRLYRNILWSQRSNLYSVPTDCPQRDERLGWMGDAQFFAVTSCWNMQMGSFYSKWMRDILDSRGDDGHVTNFAPVIVPGEAGAPGWGDAVTIIPWTVYRFYGDTRIIKDSYEAMKGWVEYMRRHSRDHLYEREGFGDWMAVHPSPPKPIGAAYYFYSTKLLSEMAAAVGRTDEAREYAVLARQITEAFDANYLDKDKNQYPRNTQAMNVLPLWFGLTPEDRRQAVLENIVRDIRERGDHLSTGTMATAVLLPVLTAHGYHNLAYRLATQTTYPSWGYMIEHGATTIWEIWNCDRNTLSHNHFALGAVGQWLYENLGGINPDPRWPGFKRSLIRPRPVDDLEWVRCEYSSRYGRIRSAWRRDRGRFLLDVSIPANTSARLFLPTGGQGHDSISEGGTTIMESGQWAPNTADIRVVGLEGDEAVLEVGAGEYHFVVTLE